VRVSTSDNSASPDRLCEDVVILAVVVAEHARGDYVVGTIHTNTIEGFWSLIKRGVVGTFHKVSRKYLPLYVAIAL
jgi:hypothetical protein